MTTDRGAVMGDLLEEELFNMVYGWGRAGVVVDSSAPAFQKVLEQLLNKNYIRGYNTGYIKAKRNDGERKLDTVADRLFNMAQELYQVAHENETKLPVQNKTNDGGKNGG